MSGSRRDNRQEQELRAIIDDIPGNDKCADCEANSPRKNSDMSKVKSISLDSWTSEQIQTMREIGNTISNYKYNPLREWPMQDDDNTMERFIRDKYERQKFMSQRETANFTPVKSAMKGSATPVEPGRTSSSVIKYSKELDMLRDMGFTDRAKNVDILKSVNGDVSAATEVLFTSADSASSSESTKKPEKPRVRFTADTIGGEEKTPQLQSANPFDLWAGQGQAGPSGQQMQDFSNPFSSIPPSMYHNQNFVQNVQQDQQQQQQFMQPIMPLRAQVTGGQPLRPQSGPPPSAESQQQIGPVTHQLTGRPAQPPVQQHIFPNTTFQQQPSSAFHQPQQQPQVQQPSGAFHSQSQQPSGIYQGQTQQQQQQQQQPQAPKQSTAPRVFQTQPQDGNQRLQSMPIPYQGQASTIPDNIFSQNAFKQPDVPFRPPSTQAVPALNPQLTGSAGLRPKFQPTVDLNAPFDLGRLQAGQLNASSQSPQQTGQNQNQYLVGQNHFQPQIQSAYSSNAYQSQSPQSTGLASSQSNTANQFRSSSPQVYGHSGNQQSLKPQNTGPFGTTTFQPAQQHNFSNVNRISPQQSGAPTQSSGTFGSTFTSPLRAELTGIANQNNPSFQANNGNNVYNNNQSQMNAFGQPTFQQSNATFTSSQHQQPQQEQQQHFGNNTSNGFQNQGLTPTTNHFSGNQAGSQQPFGNLKPQNTGSQGFSGTSQMYNAQAMQPLQQAQPLMGSNNRGSNSPMPFVQQQNTQTMQPSQFAQNNFASQQPSNGMMAQQYGQQSFQAPFQPQQTGLQPQRTGAGIDPSRPFDKASIMSLYGGQQPPPQQQQQQQFQPQTQMGNMNNYGQMPPQQTGPYGQPNQQQQYGGGNMYRNGY